MTQVAQSENSGTAYIIPTKTIMANESMHHSSQGQIQSQIQNNNGQVRHAGYQTGFERNLGHQVSHGGADRNEPIRISSHGLNLDSGNFGQSFVGNNGSRLVVGESRSVGRDGVEVRSNSRSGICAGERLANISEYPNE